MSADMLYVQARTALSRRDKGTARRLLADAVLADPSHEQSWLLLASVVDDLERAAECLRRVLALNPGNAQAREWLAQAEREQARRAAVDEMQAEAAGGPSFHEPGDEDRPVPRLGQYLLDFKFVSVAQLQAALSSQLNTRQAGLPRRLGDILVEQGALSQERLNFAVREQDRNFYSLFND